MSATQEEDKRFLGRATDAAIRIVLLAVPADGVLM